MATEAQPATQAKRILVVEDELMIRMLLEDMLGELGYTVAAEAARIDEALEATKNSASMSLSPRFRYTWCRGEVDHCKPGRPFFAIMMVPRRGRPLQTWKTFLRNHVEGIASIDLFVVPTIAFEQLFAFLVLRHERRQLGWFAVTRNPTAEWLARQITEAFPWDSAPKYLIRDNDRAFGSAFKARIRAIGIRDRPTSFRSPWQNAMLND